MNATLLLTILFCALSTGIIAFVTLLSKKKDDGRFEKMTAIATFLTSITTIIVGIATISVAKHQEDMDRLQNQPIFTIKIISEWSSEKEQNINEEYLVSNEGKKTKTKTTITNYDFLEINYTNTKDYSNITKIVPYLHYFGKNIHTNNLDGTIQYSNYSSNNLERFAKVYNEAHNYGEKHPGISVNIRKLHFFVIDYTDIYGDSYRIVKTENSDVDAETFDEITGKAKNDSGERSIDADDSNINLDFILQTYFKQESRSI